MLLQGNWQNFLEKSKSMQTIFNIINRDSKYLKHLSNEFYILLI